MPITRSVTKRKGLELQSVPEPDPSVPEPDPTTEGPPVSTSEPGPKSPIHNEGSVRQRSSNGSVRSNLMIQRAKALERLAKAKVELAEAELAIIDAQTTDGEDDDSDRGTNKDDSVLVKNWLHGQYRSDVPIINNNLSSSQQGNIGSPLKQPTVQGAAATAQQGLPQSIDIASLAAAFIEAARATTSHALPRYLSELPFFSGASNEWLAFKAAYRDTHSHFSKVENLARLRRCLRGTAKEAAISLFIAETDPDDVMRLLELRFGRPDALVMAEMDKIKHLGRLTDNPRDICLFASRIANIVAVVLALHKTHYLFNPDAVRSVVDKMTPAIKYRWYDYASERSDDEPDLIKISCFLSREAELCSRYAPAEIVREHSPESRRKPQRACAVNPTELPTPPQSKQRITQECKVCLRDNHRLFNCEQFKQSNVTDRWEIAKKFNFCFRCLNKRNFRHRCKYRPCGIMECKGSHHPLLHNSDFNRTATEDNPTDVAGVNSARPQTTERRAFLKVIPVTIRGPTGAVNTFALLDDGSTVTLIEDSVAQAVGATGPVEPFHIEGVAGSRIRADESRLVHLKIIGNGKHNVREHEIQARTIKHLHLAPQSIKKSDIERFEHLNGIVNDLVYHHGKPAILIGQDNWHLIVSTSIKNGTRGQPVASLTELGWVLHGAAEGRRHNVHFVSNITHENDNNEFDVLMKQFFDLDAIGIEPRYTKTDPNRRALAILEERSRRLPDGRFETGLLWRDDNLVLPANRDAALHRLRGIEKKLDRDPQLKAQYKEQIARLLENGFAELAPAPPRPGRTWYLPHFAVINPAKPKPRIVLDAAAKTHGMSLNDALLTGPDQLKFLPGILMRFRQKRIAVTGDIKDMFLRIGIREEDRDALRFLWRDERREGPATEYRMCSVIFGAACSPCTAIYIKNRNAEDFRREYPEAVNAIINNHYMDDYLHSFDTVEEAIRVASDVANVHRRGNFYLQKWASNSVKVLKSLAPEEKDQQDQVDLQNNPTFKTLGLVWKPLNDQLAFNLNFKKVQTDVINGSKKPTKREALRTIMSLFDPLGLVTPVIMPAKRLLQDTWRLGIGWDDELTDDLHSAWLAWLRGARQLRDLTIDRCYPLYSSAVHLEMHVFVDASETACVAAVYWRATSESSTVHLALAMAKGKVAPLKTTSIPRLELQAAVLGCRLARTVESEHDLKPARRVFWTDSNTVLAWLRAGPRVYKPFVAHRVAEVQEETMVSEWRWVPTALNVADDATRGTPSDFGRDHRWFRGPDFLYLSEESWPREPKSKALPITGEERVKTIVCNKSCHLIDSLPKIDKFSSWLRLVRTTGRILQFIDLCRPQRTIAAGIMKRTRRHDSSDLWKPTTSRQAVRKSQTRPTVSSRFISLEAHHMKAAEKLWIRAAQEESFHEELFRLRKGLPLNRDSKLLKLCLEMDREGVIRIKSRIDAASSLPIEQYNPPVLDGRHSYTRLYIAWIHKLNHHAGTETVINEIRSHLWVLRLRPTARSVIKSCIRCRILRARPALPATGNHPYTRLAHHQRPFSYVGLDYFGPCSVTVGRHHEKRYVALFTCLTTRAVHLEVAGSLSSDSAIMALRRMMARRGCPTEIHSDNGTNLRGADTELRRAACQATKEEATLHTITWRFIPPGAPFMGGAWERLVRSIKVALAATLKERHPTEEVFATLLLEVEYTVNNRPLTPVSTSPDDPESLTPLHFILGGPARVPQPGSFNDSDLRMKQRWRQTQRLADMFWARWIREYTPLLQNRREPRSHGAEPQIGDIVLIMEENLPRNVWPRGQITATYPGEDGVVRVVDVRTKTGTFRRATRKIVVLTKEMHEDARRENVHD